MIQVAVQPNGFLCACQMSDNEEMYSPYMLSFCYNLEDKDHLKQEVYPLLDEGYELISYEMYLDNINDSLGNHIYKEILKKINNGLTEVHYYKGRGEYGFKVCN